MTTWDVSFQTLHQQTKFYRIFRLVSPSPGIYRFLEVRQWGKHNTRGQAQTITHSLAPNLRSSADEQRDAKIKKGYVAVDEGSFQVSKSDGTTPTLVDLCNAMNGAQAPTQIPPNAQPPHDSLSMVRDRALALLTTATEKPEIAQAHYAEFKEDWTETKETVDSYLDTIATILFD